MRICTKSLFAVLLIVCVTTAGSLKNASVTDSNIVIGAKTVYGFPEGLIETYKDTLLTASGKELLVARGSYGGRAPEHYVVIWKKMNGSVGVKTFDSYDMIPKIEGESIIIGMSPDFVTGQEREGIFENGVFSIRTNTAYAKGVFTSSEIEFLFDLYTRNTKFNGSCDEMLDGWEYIGGNATGVDANILLKKHGLKSETFGNLFKVLCEQGKSIDISTFTKELNSL